jgi:hypothetical protein
MCVKTKMIRFKVTEDESMFWKLFKKVFAIFRTDSVEQNRS